jgi:autotransporter-associated beta strand protein
VGSLANGPALSRGDVNLAAGTTLMVTAGGTTFSGVIGGGGGLTMTGAGVQTLAGANTYAGNTTVSAGTLQLTGSGSFAASPRVTVGTAAGSSAVLDVAGVTGGANFANGGFALAAGQALAGHGTVVGPVTVRDGSTVAPGASVGTLTVDGMTWEGGGRYEFEYAGATGDRIDGTGLLNLGALSGTNRFTIHIASPGPPEPPQAFTLASFDGGITGFDPSNFAFTGFFTGSPLLTSNGNNLVLTFTPAPEPRLLLLLSAATTGVIWWRLGRPGERLARR